MPRKADVTKRVGRLWDALAQGDPEMLDANDFAPHPKISRAKPAQKERHNVQRPLVNYLRRHLPAGSKVLFIPNGTARSSRNHIFALIADGMEQGTPDLEIIIPFGGYDLSRMPRGVCRIECKRDEKQTLREAQTLRFEENEALGIPCFLAGSVDSAIGWLGSMGVQFR